MVKGFNNLFSAIVLQIVGYGFSIFVKSEAVFSGQLKIVYVFNCSQTKFVAIILVLSVFFNAIFP